MKREPLLTIATVTSVAAALLALVIAFGVSLTDAQVQALLGLTAALAPVLVALVARRQVTPVERTRRAGVRRQADRDRDSVGATS